MKDRRRSDCASTAPTAEPLLVVCRVLWRASRGERSICTCVCRCRDSEQREQYTYFALRVVTDVGA